ncbi:MAG: hypothetical protein SV377_05185, partial [Halobacteria archaeon]|nr:hypothetical protein [Halobacteria archaeon]
TRTNYEGRIKMKKAFLRELGIRQNAIVGAILGLVLASIFFYTRLQIGSSIIPMYLYFGLAVVMGVTTALFVTIVLTLGRWFVRSNF